MVQMDKHGLRLSEELSMVEAAASTLFQCIRQLPPQRRERKYIFGFLLNLIEELEKSEKTRGDRKIFSPSHGFH